MWFEDPWYLLLIGILVALSWYYFAKHKHPALKFSSLSALKVNPQNGVHLIAHLPFIMRLGALLGIVIALARPQLGSSESKKISYGLDIILAIDTSGSMRALDFEVEGKHLNRLQAVKHVIKQFIQERSNDRIGMVIFGEEAFTQAPLTLDHEVLLKFLDQVEIGVAGDATSIGDAIATATNRIKDINARSKIVILLTDGKNTSGTIEPLAAANAAQTLGVKIYTIAAGRDGKVPFPVEGFFGPKVVYQEVEIDEALLREIAKQTGAEYYRAYDTESLTEIYNVIDRLEKAKIEKKQYHDYHDIYPWFILGALVFIISEVLFATTRWQRIP